MPKKKDRHVMEALGKTRVVVENGKVVEVGQPQTDYCPIFAKVRNIRQFTPESVKGNIEFRIKDFGMFTGRREIEMEIFVGFGASETFMTALSRGLLESCVTACEGAGTVIASSPTLAQGIGSRISSLVETTPIPELIQRIEEEGVRYLIRGRQPWTRWQGWKRQSGWGTCALAFQWYVHRMSLRCVNLKSSMM